eukprot:350383-Chlamydomonas_euryale.AAC.1
MFRSPLQDAIDQGVVSVPEWSKAYVPEPQLLQKLFPFHALLDRDLRIVQVCRRLRPMSRSPTPCTLPLYLYCTLHCAKASAWPVSLCWCVGRDFGSPSRVLAQCGASLQRVLTSHATAEMPFNLVDHVSCHLSLTPPTTPWDWQHLKDADGDAVVLVTKVGSSCSKCNEWSNLQQVQRMGHLVGSAVNWASRRKCGEWSMLQQVQGMGHLAASVANGASCSKCSEWGILQQVQRMGHLAVSSLCSP